MLPIHPNVSEVYAPLIDLMGDHLLTTAEVAEHFRFSVCHLANLRRRGQFIPWVQLSTGAIRYRLADVVAAQIVGKAGPMTLNRACLAILASTDLDPKGKAAAQTALMRAFQN